LAEAESPPVTIEEWWERLVRLDRNLRQSRAEEKVLGNKGATQVARLPEAQLSRGLRPSWNNGNQGGFHGGPRGGLGGDLRRREGGTRGPRPQCNEHGQRMGGIRGASTAECLGTWPDIAGIERRLGKGRRRCQKIRETSKPSAGLP